MVTGNWYSTDGLPLQYGTSKTTNALGGQYLSYGPNRVEEFLIDLSTLNTSTPTPISFTTFFPSSGDVYIEKVEITAEVAMSTTGSPTLSVGLGSGNPFSSTTVIDNTAFINAQAASGLSTAGDLITYSAGTAAAGDYVGDYNSATSFASGYVTAILGSHTATGKMRVRIYWHGVGTITQ